MPGLINENLSKLHIYRNLQHSITIDNSDGVLLKIIGI